MSATHTSSLLPRDRALGALEELFWLYDQWTPFHFVLAGEIIGQTTPEDWRVILDKVQARHPLLSVAIRSGHSTSEFVVVHDVAIPLRVVDSKSQSTWQDEAAKELFQPFDPSQAPLIRAVVWHSSLQSVLILVAHHSIADGLSLSCVFRDALQVLSGVELEAMPLPQSQESSFGLPAKTSNGQASPVGAIPEVAPELLLKPRQPNPHPPILQSRRFSPDLTWRLLESARNNETTVHGALCAALILAGSQFSDKWKTNPVQILSPISTRKLAGIGEQLSLAIGVARIASPPDPSGDLWTLARTYKRMLAQYETPEGIASLGKLVGELINGDPGIPQAVAFNLFNFTSDGMISNLGVVPFETEIGAYSLRSLWGPSIITGVPGEQVLGTATVNGSLCLLHTSYSPFPLLLERMEEILSAACNKG